MLALNLFRACQISKELPRGIDIVNQNFLITVVSLVSIPDLSCSATETMP